MDAGTGMNDVVGLQVDGKHDGQGVCNDRGNVVAVGMSRHIVATLPFSQIDGKPGHSQGTDKKSQGIARKQMTYAER